MKPWMKYVGVGLLGLVIGAAAAGGGEKPKAETITRTVAKSPSTAALARARSDLRAERRKLTRTTGMVSSRRSQLRDLTGRVAAAKKNTFAGTGTYLVGEDIMPGTYRADATPGCYWARLSSLDTSDIVDNDNADGSVVLAVLPSDKALLVKDCGEFRKAG